MKHEFKNVPGFPKYQCNCDGIILSNFINRRTGSGGQLKPKTNPGGYLFVDLWNDEGHKYLTIHRIVALTWLKPPPKKDKYQVTHKDGNKMNNNVSNLEYNGKRLANYNNLKHNLSNTPTYNSWKSMIQRCKKTSHPSINKRYGSRGITVAVRWFKFENFLNDMGMRPIGKTLDRIDNNQGYYKTNCRWVTVKEQAYNRHDNILIKALGKSQTMPEWALEMNLNLSTLWSRWRRGLRGSDILNPKSIKTGSSLV